MEEFFALGKEDAPENIPMMFITMPSAKDPEAKIRHPSTNPLLFLLVLRRLLVLLRGAVRGGGGGGGGGELGRFQGPSTDRGPWK